VPINVWEEDDGSWILYYRAAACTRHDSTGLATEKRIVLDTRFIAFCLLCQPVPFRTWNPAQETLQPIYEIFKKRSDELSGAMRQVIAKVEAALDQPALYYIYIRTL